MKKVIMIVTAVMIVMTTKAMALNPANIVGLYERFPVAYAAAHYCPGGARMSVVNIPTTKTTNVGITQWTSKDGSVKDLELDVAASVSNHFEASFYTVALDKGSTTLTHTLGLKYSANNASIATILPFKAGDATKLGASWSHGRVTLFTTVTLDSEKAPIVGFTYKGKIATIDYARTGHGTDYIRIAKGFPTKSGTIKPEIRIQDEKVGLTLGFFPK